jgi:glycosyltransferase involved in cell wall biosynthesis
LNILFLNDYITQLGGAEVVIKNVMEQSKHNIELQKSTDLPNINLNNYDIIHLHSLFDVLPNRKLLKSRKVVWSLHGYVLDCTKQSGLCNSPIIKRNCLGCHGVLGYTRFYFKRLRAIRDLVYNYLSYLLVHSDWMLEYYAIINPIRYVKIKQLPIPLETKDMTISNNKEDYIFFSARCVFDKNPLGFIKICDELGIKGKMALYYLTGRPLFKDYMERLRRSHNVEVFLDLEKKDLFDLYKHAKLTVHPHVYAEPFGIGSANSILLGTPLITYPFGNLKNLATVISYPLNNMIKTVDKLMKDEYYYQLVLEQALMDRNKLIQEHNSIKLWDEFYEQLAKD